MWETCISRVPGIPQEHDPQYQLALERVAWDKQGWLTLTADWWMHVIPTLSHACTYTHTHAYSMHTQRRPSTYILIYHKVWHCTLLKSMLTAARRITLDQTYGHTFWLAFAFVNSRQVFPDTQAIIATLHTLHHLRIIVVRSSLLPFISTTT